VARVAQCERIIDAQGVTIEDPIINRNGDVIGHRTKKHPAVQASKEYTAQMLRAGALLGLNPQDRQRVGIPENDKEDELDKIFKEAGL
jgi:P27 family predicted phage terminase small subunit